MKMQIVRTLGGTIATIALALTSIAPVHADQSITTQIDAITARSAVAGNSWSMLVSDASGSVTYYQKNQTTTEAPASNMKIVTSSAAFGLLGTNNSFVTTVYRNGTFSAGTVTGDINLLVKHDITWNDNVFGTGNARKALDFIATQLKNQGITKITGKVQVYGACMYNHADTDDTRDIANQATYNGEGATAFKAALQAQGITVSGVAAGVSGFSAPGTLIYTYNSTSLTYGGKPLRLDVACIPMNKVSHNVMADLLLRHIAYEKTGSDSFTAGANQVFGWLKNTVGLATNDMVMLDGSGLSHSDRMSAKEINTITRYMVSHFSSWATTLPIGCVDGTISSRFCGTDASGRVHAKTGSLSITISLSGYVDNKYNSQRYYFSFLANNSAGIDQTSTRQALDDAVNVIAGVIPTTIDGYAGNDGNRALDIALPTSSNTTEVDAESGANGSFTGWTSIGGPTGSGAAPVVGYQADQRIQLFLRGSDNNVYTVTKALNGAWGSWTSLGGNVRSSVSVGYLANGAMQIFARSSTNTVITSTQSGPNGTFGAWSNLGGQCYDDPTVAANTDGRFQLFTRSAANTVYSNFKTTSGTWFGWSDYGGSCMGKPRAGQWTNGVIVLLTRTSAGTISMRTQNDPNGSWGAWTDLGGTAASDPVVTYNADGRMQFFVQTPSHTVSMNFRTGLATNSSWFGWLSMGGTSYSNLGVGINADGTIHVFTRDSSRVVWSAWQTNANSSFTGWSSLGGNTLAAAMTAPTTTQTTTTTTQKTASSSTLTASSLQTTQSIQDAMADGSTTLPNSSTWARVYQVQYNDGSGWINLGDPVVANGNSITINDTAAAHTRRSYRAIVVQ